MSWSCHVLLRRSDRGSYSLTFSESEVGNELLPAPEFTFASESSLCQFLDGVLKRDDGKYQVQRANLQEEGVGFWQTIDGRTLSEIKKIAGSAFA